MGLIKNLKFIMAVAVLMGLPLESGAQIVVSGDDPAGVRWNQIRTTHFRVIYPMGTDSLARTYANQLEFFYPLEAQSLGYHPSSRYRKPMDVVLHNHFSAANGSVSWAPRIMNLYTFMNSNNPEPLQWSTNLAVHESRHAAQMQFGKSGWLFNLGNILLGQMVPGALAGVYPSNHLLEGDAVVAETGLTDGGRGRQAEFLNYYHAAFDAGDWRNWHRWRWGSFKKYTPNWYALGYMTIGGARWVYDRPDFMNTYFGLIKRRQISFGTMQGTMYRMSGKSFRASFREIQEAYHNEWEAAAEARGTFMPQTPLYKENGKWWIEFDGLANKPDGGIYALRSGTRETQRLVSMNSAAGDVGDADTQTDNSNKKAVERIVRPFSSNVGLLDVAPDGTLWWSETQGDLRWTHASHSNIRYMSPGSKRARNLTRKGRESNPAVSPDGSMVAAVSYPVKGGSGVKVFDVESRSETAYWKAPDSLQVFQNAWSDDMDRLWLLGVSSHGEGVYQLDIERLGNSIRFGRLSVLLEPSMVSLSDLHVRDGKVYFSSDRTGVGEFYCLNPQSSEIEQLTSSRYGGQNYTFSENRDTLFYASVSDNDRLVYYTLSQDLPIKKVDFSQCYLYPDAEAISAQEKALAKGEMQTFDYDALLPERLGTMAEEESLEALKSGRGVPSDFDGGASQPKRYRKFPNLPRIHSWVPAYVQTDDILSLSFDESDETAEPGATIYLQNALSTFYGTVSYAWKPSWDNTMRSDGTVVNYRRSSGHADLTYSGLFPVFNLKFDIGDRPAHQYFRRQITHPNGQKYLTVNALQIDQPLVNAELTTYIPFNFSGGGWNRGLVPQVSYQIYNDRFNKADVLLTGENLIEGQLVAPRFEGTRQGKNMLMQTVKFSVRGYIMQSVASSREYPKWGIGAEMGYRARIGLADRYTADYYIYGYGYLPGFSREQGLRLTATWQYQFTRSLAFGENHVTVRPRGFQDSPLSSYLATYSPAQLSLTAEYSIPFSFGDISWLSPAFYIRNFVLRPNFDYLMFANHGGSLSDGGLFSAGAMIGIHFGNILFLPYDTTAGIVINYNGGKSYNALHQPLGLKRVWCGFAFDMDFQ